MNEFDVIVIIATSMLRTDSLINRSLISVYNQTTQPQCIYIVDDNEDKREFHLIKNRIKTLRKKIFADEFPITIPQGHFHTRTMRNSRTKKHSGSGAWNTAAMHAYRNYSRGRKTYIAILDDDDAWHESYLSRAIQSVSASKEITAGVVSTFYRCENDRKTIVHVKKKSLTPTQFFIGNPGWQGSNTFVELTAFWQAGGYDESMESTHDRDFAIRLLDVCAQNNYSINTIDEPLVFHYVHDGERVTTCFDRKKQGLDSFYRKYTSRMNKNTIQQSLTRANKLFSYRADSSTPKPRLNKTTLTEDYKNSQPSKIIFGVTSSDSHNIELQMASLARQITLEPQFIGFCDYVILTNGNNESLINSSFEKQKNSIFHTHLIDTSKQNEFRVFCLHQEHFQSEPLNKKSIAHSRTMLNYFCGKVAHKKYNNNCIVVILDDDLTFESLITEDNQVTAVSLNFLGKLSELQKTNTADILISDYSDAPPLPFYSSMRTQLIDVLHTARLFSPSNNKAIDHNTVNSSIFKQHNDYYYDLSSVQFNHLESPLRWRGIDVESAFGSNASLLYFLKDIAHLASESNITRPLTLNAEEWSSLSGYPCYKRGGIAIYLNLSLLKVPNLSPNIMLDNNNRRTRRSDFISSIIITEALGKQIQKISFPLRHNRRQQKKPCHMSANKLIDDVIGLCFYRVFKHWLSNPDTSNRRLRANFNHGIRECLGKLKVNNLRTIQLLDQLETFLLDESQLKTRTECNATLTKALSEAISSIRHIKIELAERKFNQQIKAAKKSLNHFDTVHQIHTIHQAYKKMSIPHHTE